MRNLYRDVKNTLIMHPRLYRELLVHFKSKMLTWTDSSKGYTCNKRSLLGMELESCVWCEEKYAYYFDKQGDVHSVIIDWDKGVFNVPSL